MRYAVFTDIHANLEALEAVLEKIDEIAAKEPIDQIWFLGDLVGYGPDPNECILKLRERTDVIIAGNHDWAAVGKIDLEDFSPAARISAEWTAERLTREHRQFLANLPERLEIGQCTLVHGSPYGPLWEYLTEETLAERSFQYFSSRYCFVGHTHVPVIFQQLDIANTPTLPLGNSDETTVLSALANGNGTVSRAEDQSTENTENPGDFEDETAETALLRPPAQQMAISASTDSDEAESAFVDIHGSIIAPDEAAFADSAAHELDDDSAAATTLLVNHVNPPIEDDNDDKESAPGVQKQEPTTSSTVEQLALLEAESLPPVTQPAEQVEKNSSATANDETATSTQADTPASPDQGEHMEQLDFDDYMTYLVEEGDVPATTSEGEIAGAEERLNSEIEELLSLLGLSQSMVQITNEMLTPPEGHWEAPEAYRAIVNAGGVGQPRDGDPRAAFMIYDTERGFEFYRVPYDYEKTQEKIIKAELPQFLAVRLQYGR